MVAMCSGIMWVRIRGAPYQDIALHGKRTFTNSMQSQFGIESRIIAFCNLASAISVIALSTKVPQIANPKARRLACLMFMAVLLVSFSAEVAAFRSKVGLYPFRLLFA